MSRSQIDQARLELQKWDARVEQDRAAVTAAEHHLKFARERLDASTMAWARLRVAIGKYEAAQTDHENELSRL